MLLVIGLLLYLRVENAAESLQSKIQSTGPVLTTNIASVPRSALSTVDKKEEHNGKKKEQETAVLAAGKDQDKTEEVTKDAAYLTPLDDLTEQVGSEGERNIAIVAKQASIKGFGNCGIGENRTSLKETAEVFSQHRALEIERNSEKSGDYFGVFRQIAVEFQAVDVQGKNRTFGGDEFVLTFWAWTTRSSGNDDNHTSSTDTFAFKTAVVANDQLNGRYSATLKVPTSIGRLQRFNLTLTHWYTCFQGVAYKPIELNYYTLDFGPKTVVPHESFSRLLQENDTENEGEEVLGLLPFCNASQAGVDQLTNGAWIERGVSLLLEISPGAKWVPFQCRMPPRPAVSLVDIHRIGDSTMPYRTVEVGDPYFPNPATVHRDRWVSYLLNVLPSSEPDSVLVINGGLHPILHEFNAEASTMHMMRMFCQAAVMFPGKMIMVGPMPIQQHRYQEVDMTDGTVLATNSIMKQKFNDARGHLDILCEGVDLDVFRSLPDDKGYFLPRSQTEVQFERQAGGKYNDLTNQTKLVKKLRDALTKKSSGDTGSNATTIYKDRVAFFAQIHDFMLPRPETYRDHDKVHDVDPIKGIMYGEHSNMIEDLVALRGLAGR